MPKTPIGWFNFLVLQWFGIRIARLSISESGRVLRWGLIGPLLPLTGWWSDYIGRNRVLVHWGSSP